ncbi:helix-turn-helix domain-containing protein [Streptomyces albus]
MARWCRPERRPGWSGSRSTTSSPSTTRWARCRWRRTTGRCAPCSPCCCCGWPTPVRPAPPPARPTVRFARFRAAVERDLSRTHRVADYAAALGYSTRTLTRATRAATGTTAKNYLDTRILLEAKRLLVHTDAGSADIARRLGFGDPGDFGKFFRRLDGRTPLAFRAQARGTPGR